MARIWLAGLALGLLLSASPFPLGRPGIAAAQSGPAAEVLQLINQVRAEHGLTGYGYSATLAVAAQNHANWMAATGIYSHTGESGSTPLSRAQAAGYNGAVSENIVGGTNMSPNQGILWWRNSPTHYNTLVSTRYSEAGIGFATDGNQNFYVLVVGRPSNSPPAVVDRSAETSAAPLLITPITLAQPRADGSIVHVIQQGQALWTIAAYYDVDLDYLYLINGFTKATVLHPGDEVTVRLPDGASPPPTPTPPLTYTIQQGDSIWSIASANSISVDLLLQLNGLSPNAVLHAGNEIRVRLAEGEAPPPTPTPPLTYLVRSGDSLWSIAARHGLGVDELLAMNNLTADTTLFAGMELRVVAPTPEPPAPAATPALLEAQPASATPSPTATASPMAIANAVRLPAASTAARTPASPERGPNVNLWGAAAGLALIAGLVTFRLRSRPR